MGIRRASRALVLVLTVALGSGTVARAEEDARKAFSLEEARLLATTAIASGRADIAADIAGQMLQRDPSVESPAGR